MHILTKLDLFPSDVVRKPRHSAAIPTFSFSSGEKNSHLGKVFIAPSIPVIILHLSMKIHGGIACI